MTTDYAILAATDRASTLHAHSRDWCKTFAYDCMLLSADGLSEPGTDVPPPTEANPKDLAQSVDLDARELGWEDDATLYVLADPELLDSETGDVFRRSLRVVLKRLADEVVFPYDDLAENRRGGWLVACLGEAEIKNPKKKYRVDRRANSDQRDLDSF